MCTVDARLWILTVEDLSKRESNAAKRSRCEFDVCAIFDDYLDIFSGRSDSGNRSFPNCVAK